MGVRHYYKMNNKYKFYFATFETVLLLTFPCFDFIHILMYYINYIFKKLVLVYIKTIFGS